MADRARLEREITHELMQNDDKLSLVALTYKMMEAHLDSAGPGVLKKLGDCSMEEFLGATEVGRALMAATQWDEKRMQGLKTHISWEDFRRKAHMLSKSIFENFKLLGNILDRHEATIHRRWLKKSNKLRLAIICEAWGVKMASSHRPDFEALELEDDTKRVFGTEYRDHYLLPYINEEDLCKPRSLLLLMSTRSRCHPSELATSEYNAHRSGRSAFIFSPSSCKELDDHRMDLTSRGGDGSYGQLWSVESHPDHCVALKDQPCSDPSDGILILEAQERVLSFLVKCAELLLHGFTADTILQSPVVSFQLPPRLDVVHTSLATIAAEAPYQKPDSLDFSRIATLLTAKRDAAADHLWSLREDPSYFEAQMLEVREHRRELVLDSAGKQHPICSPEHEDKFWARIMYQEITRAIHQVEIFDELQSRAEELRNMQKLYADEFGTSHAFPEPYTAALMQFGFCLSSAATSFNREIGLGLSASEPIRPYFERCPEEDPNTEVEGLRKNPNLKLDAVRARLTWLAGMLWDMAELFRMIGPVNIIDELQRLVDTHSAKSLLSTYLASLVGDLSIVSECIHQLELYLPWVQKHGGLLDVTEAQKNNFARELQARMKPWVDSVNAIREDDSALGSLGKPTDGKFAYPIAKRRTRENVELMRQAERNLDKFWQKVDQDIESVCGRLADGAVHRLFTQDRTLQRTPEWIAPVHESTKPVVEKLYVPFSQLFFDDQTSSKDYMLGELTKQPKQKIKTRKAGNSETTAAENDAAVPIPEAQTEPLFALNARALKVFKTIFFTPSVTSTPGEVAWVDFLHAMISVGFVPQKLYGSVWQFSPDPDKLPVERSIQFHEPHGGNSKIPYRIARRHGRRLNRAYG